jgi:hypothetical protein
MGRPRLNPDRVLTPAERALRYRRQHGERINRTLRTRRQAATQPQAVNPEPLGLLQAEETTDPPPPPAVPPVVSAPPVPQPPAWLPEWLRHRCCVCRSARPVRVFGPPVTPVHRWACSDHVHEVNRALIAARDPR